MDRNRRRNRPRSAPQSRWRRISNGVRHIARVIARHRVAIASAGVVSAIVTAFAGQYLYESWMVPDLYVTYAVGYEERGVRPGADANVYYHELRDLRHACLDHEMSITLSPPKQGPRPAARLLLWLLIDNKGKRVASDVRLTVAFSVPILPPRVIATPNVSATLLNHESSSRLESYTIVVESISSRTPAVIVLSVPGDREIFDALTTDGLKLNFPLLTARELPITVPSVAEASVHDLRDKESTLTVGKPSFTMDVSAYVRPSLPPPPEEGTAWYRALPTAPACSEEISHKLP